MANEPDMGPVEIQLARLSMIGEVQLMQEGLAYIIELANRRLLQVYVPGKDGVLTETDVVSANFNGPFIDIHLED